MQAIVNPRVTRTQAIASTAKLWHRRSHPNSNCKTVAQAIAQTHTLTLESSQKIALQSQFFSNPKSALFA
jgi:hypothetical protein